jgi:hypothetical protein
MTKIDLKPTFAINSNAIVAFIARNSENDWKGSYDIFTDELNYITENLPDEIEAEVEYRVFRVYVNVLQHDGWIKKFTNIQELMENYIILFTD